MIDPQPRRLRVLCAEDDMPVAELLKRVLELNGHAVECVDDGAKALDLIRADAAFYDVLITDHRMPVMSGLGLVAKVRETAFAGLIVVHSSQLSPVDGEAYRALAVDHILEKPTRMPILLRLLGRPAGAPQP